MCICFGYNSQIFFLLLFSQIEFSQFLGVNYHQGMCFLGHNSQIIIFFCFGNYVSFTYSIHDSSYIKRILPGGGHKFSVFSC